MKKNTSMIRLIFVLIFMIASFFSVPLVSANSDNATEEILEAKTELGKLYSEINPSVVYISVKSVKGASATNALPMDRFQDLMPFIQEFFNSPNQNRNQQNDPTEEQYSYNSGTGFVWDDKGHIVTNYHVIEGAVEVRITYHDGIVRDATVIGEDPDSDLAVLAIEDFETGLTPLRMGDSDELEVGEFVAAIGNPFGNTGTITVGIVSALGRSFILDDGDFSNSHYQIPDMIQTDAAINPGNSGGVLINLDGEVVGVVNSFSSTTYASAGIGYAIPANLAKRVIPSLISSGAYQHPWIGFSGISLTNELNETLGFDRDQRGALIQSVIADSPAEAAGIRGGKKTLDSKSSKVVVDGDVITMIEDRKVSGMDDIIAYLASNTSVGDTITLSGIRDGKEAAFEVTLRARPTLAERTAKPTTETKASEPSANPWLGTTVRNLDVKTRSELDLDDDVMGVLVTSVSDDSPASDAAIEVDDVIVSFDGTAVTTVDELKELLFAYAPGERVSLTILRDREEIDLRLTLGSQPGL